ncbi:MAG TPA: hypothetical protein VK673_17300 [Chthoniobacterales bacterium]|nr:hypothetical protein [Chthoniobacterales bacterium]
MDHTSNQEVMEMHTIELSTDELLLIARVTGVILGYAVPDRYCDRRLVLTVFNKAQKKLSESVSN